MDLRPGGKWRFTMHGADGRDYENRIEFIEVTKPSRLVYRHRDAGEDEPIRFQVTATFAPLGGKTLLTMRALSENAEELVRIEEAYGASEVNFRRSRRDSVRRRPPSSPPPSSWSRKVRGPLHRDRHTRGPGEQEEAREDGLLRRMGHRARLAGHVRERSRLRSAGGVTRKAKRRLTRLTPFWARGSRPRVDGITLLGIEGR